MQGQCRPQRAARFWQYSPAVETVPLWVAIHCNFNPGKIELTCCGEDWTLDPGDFVIERAPDQVFVLSEGEFHQLFDICAEPAQR